ncbi:hypothetical protein V1291_000575 [Nitrobacteraceae bacterium AZCC 1564]
MKTARSLQLASLSGCVVFNAASVVAETSPAPGTTATRPAEIPRAQTSAPNASPPASIDRIDGSG